MTWSNRTIACAAARTEVVLGGDVDVGRVALLAEHGQVRDDVDGINVPRDEAQSLVALLQALGVGSVDGGGGEWGPVDDWPVPACLSCSLLTLTTSLTPRLTYLAPEAFFTSLYSFLVSFLPASGLEMGLSALSRSSYVLAL